MKAMAKLNLETLKLIEYYKNYEGKRFVKTLTVPFGAKETKGCRWIFMVLLYRLFVTADEQFFRF